MTHLKPFAIRLFRFILLTLILIVPSCGERQIAEPTIQMDIPAQYWIRVLTLDNAQSCLLKIPSFFSVSDYKTQNIFSTFDKTRGTIKVAISDSKITIAGRLFDCTQLLITPDNPYMFTLNGNTYRGKLKLIINPDRNSFDVINLVPIEPYLAGVVGAEMPNYWEPAALRAQTIVARTYCLYLKKRFGKNRNWDVGTTQSTQVYKGLKAESTQIWDAINKTKGLVLTCKQSDGSEDIFPTYYSSVCGGHTENSRNVFGDSFQPLAGVDCPYCWQVAKPSLFYWPTAEFDKAEVSAKLLAKYPSLKKLEKITNLTPTKQSNYLGQFGKFSRINSIKLSGSSGETGFLRGEDLRLSIDPSGRKIQSTIFQILDMADKWVFMSGRGWGHGVGLCQCGAQAMARQGKSTEDILNHYYPNSKLEIIDYH